MVTEKRVLLNVYDELMHDCRRYFKKEDLTIDELLKMIRLASLRCGEEVCLSSKRTILDEDRFVKFLINTEYYPGYGEQYLFGIIVFNDESWLERGEYDGSEWWEIKRMPKEPNWEE